VEKQPIAASVVYLKVQLDFLTNANRFYFSVDNENFTPFGKDFQAAFGFWKGARVGLFSYNEQESAGVAHFSQFRYDYEGPK
jgi:beta-xylosidase